MKKLILLLSGIVCFGMLYGHNEVEQKAGLEDAVFRTIQAFSDRDSATINKMINDDLGLYIIYIPGTVARYGKVTRIDFDDYFYKPLPRIDSRKSYEVRYELLPMFDCLSGKWDKTGVFCDLSESDYMLTGTALTLKDFFGEDDISEELIESFRDIEGKSHKVSFVTESGEDLTFSLILMNGKWYLIIIDIATSDCGT